MANGECNMENDMVITSPSNERLKHARRVRDGCEPDLMFVEGARLVQECLQSGLKLRACFHEADPTPLAQRLIDEMASRGCPLYRRFASRLRRSATPSTPRG